MESDHVLKQQVYQIIENQIKENEPKETKLTFERLSNQGYNDEEIRQMIGLCLSIELFERMKKGKPFDAARYIKNLEALPDEPKE